MKMNPYLVFEGNAREAIQFYEQALGAKVLGDVMTFGQMPTDPNYPLPEGTKNFVAHAHLKVGEADLMFSDSFPGQPVNKGNNISIMVSAPSVDKARDIFNALAAGGQVEMPFQETFWSPGYGKLTDKFGVGFQVNTDTANQ